MARDAGVSTRSEALYQDLSEVIPGGVNSPFRGFQHVPGGPPMVVMRRGSGARIVDVDDNEYVDYVCAWGPLILGHAHPEVVAAATSAAAEGSVFGASTEAELRFALRLREIFPSMEMLRFVNSGAEAVQAAVRLARSATGRAGLVKLEGGYHGHVESLDMADTPSAAAASGSDPRGLARVVPFNDAGALEALLAREPIAAVVMEPVTGSVGVIEPLPGYLASVRALCDAHGVLLIFDEVLTGFRVALGGAHERYGVRPDITVLGKILGGGFPAGAYGGSRALMSHVAPLGPMYQAGTFCGNPVTMRAGLATVEVLSRPGTYERLEALTSRLCSGLEAAGARAGVPLQAPHAGSMFGVLFVDAPVRNASDYARCDDARFARFFHGMLERGFYFPPSQSDAAVVSTAHTEDDIDRTVRAAEALLDG